MRTVDRVYDNQVLQKFWRKGTLVANHGRKHPYQSDIPPEYKDADRWFLLETSLTPKELRSEEFDNARPPAMQTEIPVFALALVLGARRTANGWCWPMLRAGPAWACGSPFPSTEPLRSTCRSRARSTR